MSEIPSIELLHERIERTTKDYMEMRERIDSMSAAVSDIKADVIVDRGVLASTSRHAHKNTDTLTGKDGLLTRVQVLEKIADESAETNKALRSHALKLLVLVSGKVLWDVIAKISSQ